jgi:toxin FitB
MSGFLIDTNVLSEYNRPGGPDLGVKRWLETTERQLQHVSIITLAEIQKGIELLARGGQAARAT